MDSHSRSASPRDPPRPQHRPPSPPLSPTAYDNQAYQHDDPNHNGSFTSNGHQNGHSKEPNGDTKTLEAVNLELINLTPKNGTKKKDVEVDMNATNPYDEYFVPVNEHKKYMRGEKLYVTADKRGEKGGCKRPLCWTLLGLVVAAIVALIVLAATGILFTSSPTTLEQYNASISSARAFGAITHDHDHDHDHQHDHAHDHTHNHDHNHDHGHHEMNDSLQNEQEAITETPHEHEDGHHLTSEESADMYVPRTVEGELKVDNKVFVSALEDPDSDEYKEFTKNFNDALKSALFDRNTLENGSDEITVEVVQIRNGSVIVTYRIHWNPKHETESTEDLLTANSLQTNLNKYLQENNRMISVYHIADDKLITRPVLDLCKINNNDCEYKCEFDETTLDFSCTCPRGQMEDSKLPKRCTPILDNSIISKTHTIGSDQENNYDWKDAHQFKPEITTTSITDIDDSHIFGQSRNTENNHESIIPILESTSEPKAEPEPSPTSEPEPAPTSEPEPTPKSEPEPLPTSEPTAYVLESETKLEPLPTSEPAPEPEPKLESIPEPTSEPEPVNEPNPEPAITTTSKGFETVTEPVLEPETIPSPEPTPEPKPVDSHIPELSAEYAVDVIPILSTTTETYMRFDNVHISEIMAEPKLRSEESQYSVENDSSNGTKHNTTSTFKIINSHEELGSYTDTTIEPEMVFNSDSNLPHQPLNSEMTTENNVVVTIMPTYNESEHNLQIKPKTNSENIFNLEHLIEEQSSSNPTEEFATEVPLSTISVNQAQQSISENSIPNAQIPPSEKTEFIENSDKILVEHTGNKNATDIVKGSIEKISSPSLINDHQPGNDDDWLQNDIKNDSDVMLSNTATNINNVGNNENLLERDQRVSKTFNDFNVDVTTIKSLGDTTEEADISFDDIKQKYGTLQTDKNYESNAEKRITEISIPAHDNIMHEEIEKNVALATTEESDHSTTEIADSDNSKYEEFHTTESSKFKFISTYKPYDMPTIEGTTTHNVIQLQEIKRKAEVDGDRSATDHPIDKISNVLKEDQNLKDVLNISNHSVIENTGNDNINESPDKSFTNTNVVPNSKLTIFNKPHLENHVSTTAIPKDDTESSDSDWLTVSVTEINYGDLKNNIETLVTTQIPITGDEIMNPAFKNDFEPDYFSNLGNNNSKIPIPDEPTYGMRNDYEDDDTRIKKENTNQVQDIKQNMGKQFKSEEMSTNNPKENQFETTTVSEYIYKIATSNNDQSSDNSQTNLRSTFATPVWTPENRDIMVSEMSTSNNSSQGESINMENNSKSVEPSKDLGVTIYEISSHNSNHSLGRKTVSHQSSEFIDHETEMNPFLPEIENNKILVKKLQEGNDLELTNLNETQNENGDEHHSIHSHLTKETEVTSQSENDTASYIHNELINAHEESKPIESFNEESIPTSSIEQTTVMQELENPETSSKSSFLTDTDDLDKNISSGSFKGFNNDYFSVLPLNQNIGNVPLKNPYNNENIQALNDISDSPKKSDRTIDLGNLEYNKNNEA